MSALTTAIEQLNLGYNQLEDRLLLKVGMADQSEIALWITRRVCKELWHLLQESHEQMVSMLKESDPLLEADEAEKKVEAIALPAPKMLKKAKVAATDPMKNNLRHNETMDFNQTYAANRKPLADSPILVMSCEIKAGVDQKNSLSFKAKAGEVVTMGLTLELVVALTNMMQLATKEASWDLLMLQKHATRHLAPSSEVIH